jgi:hypothetical protein
MVDLLYGYLTDVRGLADAPVRAALLADYQGSGAKGRPKCLAELLDAGRGAAHQTPVSKPRAERQGRHLAQALHRDEIAKAAAAA